MTENTQTPDLTITLVSYVRFPNFPPKTGLSGIHPVSVIQTDYMENKSGHSANDPCVDGSPLGWFDWCFCTAGWSGHVSDLFMRHILPLALMPFARSGSRSIARTRSAGSFWVFPFRRFQPAFCINSCRSFPTSVARSTQRCLYHLATGLR